MKASITSRKPVPLATARAIADYAKGLGAWAGPVYDLDGRIDEMGVRANGLQKGTIFMTREGQLATWLNSKTQETAEGPLEAVERCLRGLA